MKEKLISYLKGITLFLVASAATTTKCFLFMSWCLGWVLPWHYFNPDIQWLAILSASMGVASFVWIFRHKWISIIPHIVTDLWIIANIVYFRANRLLLTYSAIAMSSNLHGFESAILGYLDAKLLWIPAMTLFYALLVFVFNEKKRFPIPMALTWVAVIACSISASNLRCIPQNRGIGSILNYEKPITWEAYQPFCTAPDFLPEMWQMDMRDINYCLQHSIVAYGIEIITEGRARYLEEVERKNSVSLTSEEIQNIQTLLKRGSAPKNASLHCDDNLLIVIVESWEDWTMNVKNQEGQTILPQIQGFMQRHPHLFVPKVREMVRHGVSADGQMIINTGMLPLIDGAACILYGDNKYPNLAHFYTHSANVDACSKAWNGEVTCSSYEYQQHIAPDNEDWRLEDISEPLLEEYLKEHTTSTCAQLITIASHNPFNRFSPEETHPVGDFDELSVRYLNMIHWTDNILGNLFRFLEDNGFMENTTVVLTGDHTFHREPETYFCPLVMFSPAIKQTRVINEIANQMDIYTTILSLIGRKDYFWQGFGADLTQPEFTRPFSNEASFAISDKMIRTDYFNKD